MMRQIKYLGVTLVFFILITGGYYLIQYSNLFYQQSVSKDVLESKKVNLETKAAPDSGKLGLDKKGEVFQWIGDTSEQLLKHFGDPARIDPSAYGYEWWIYNKKDDQYIQFGVEGGKIKTIFAVGKGLSTHPLSIGKSYDDIRKKFSFSDTVTYRANLSSYTFKLKSEDVQMRPLIKLADNVFVQCYFDTISDKLSAIRISTPDILLKQRPYAIQYRGDLPEPPELKKAEWKKIEHGMEQQIFDITNVFRHQFGKSQLKWNGEVQKTAFQHSKDMAKQNYFSHYSQNGDGLKERLAASKIYYFSAGENIAAQYPDAPAAMEGWLNSKGHRDALLKKDYTHLGVGVYHFYYTQNFVEEP